MDELLQLVLQFIQQIEANSNDLDDAESAQIAKFLQEVMGFIQKESQRAIPEVQPNVPQGADLLWILSGGQPNAFVNYLRTYPGEGFQELVSNPNRLASLIQRLQQTNPIAEAQEGAGGIPNAQLASSNVSGMKYDRKTGKLLVRFHGKNGEPIYQYDGVPPGVFSLLEHGNAFAKTKGKNKWGEWWPMKNPSLGAAVNEYLKKGNYNYKRIS